MSAEHALSAEGLSMTFGQTTALSDVSLHVEQGECLGIVGRNGAGKSTVVSILTGLQRPDSGTVTFHGSPAPPGGQTAAWQEHVACVYQHSMLVPSLTVAENVFLNRPLTRAGRLLDWRAMRSGAAEVMGEWGFDVDVTARAADISVEQRQVVEIARALSMGTRCLILDEPTAALERGAVERLMATIRPLLSRGVAIIYISHHLEEVFDVCDRVTILRDGRHVLTAPTTSLSEAEMVRAMVGDEVSGTADAPADADVADSADDGGTGAADRRPYGDLHARDSAVDNTLQVHQLVAATSRGRIEGVDLTVHGGELVGLLGLRGSGTTVLADVIAGMVTPVSGEVSIGGRRLPTGSPAAAQAHGVGYVPEDRHARGFVPMLGVGENITMSILRRFTRRGILSPRSQSRGAGQLAERFGVVSAGMQQPVGELSGGNQQKVVVGRALATDPRVLVAVSPTQGVDVASKQALLDALDGARRGGSAVLLVSDDLDDLAYATRIVVMVRGRVFTELTEQPWVRQTLITASEGLEQDPDASAPDEVSPPGTGQTSNTQPGER